jgi:pyruvate formate lyase activating enzyme
MSVREAVGEISKDEIFFFHSGGGVTISGGEPCNQADFVAAVLRGCRERGIHTAVETSLYASWERIEEFLPWLNVLYVDIKHMNPEIHKQWVGTDNAIIFENIRRIDQSAYPIEIVVRIPMVPGANDADENLLKTGEFCQTIKKLKELELLAYHRLGMEAYKNLGREYALKDLVSQSTEEILKRAGYLAQQYPDIPIRVGGGFAGNAKASVT